MNSKRSQRQSDEFSRAMGARIRECRRKCGMSPRELGRQIFYTPDAVRKMERGERMPPYEVIYRIAKLSNTTTDYLIGGEFQTTDDALRSVRMAVNILIEVLEKSAGHNAPGDPKG